MTDVLHCKRCGGPLKVVCDARGTDWVPDRRIGPTDPSPRPPVVRSAAVRRRASVFGPTPGTRRAQIYELVSTDAAEPTRPPVLMEQLGMSRLLACVELAAMTKQGLLKRVGRSAYIKADREAEAC